MGKKDFFKLPSKKTLEYILIGILFVAVLSCTMKIIKNIEGFNSCSNNLEEPQGGSCSQTGATTSSPLNQFSVTTADINTLISGTNTIIRVGSQAIPLTAAETNADTLVAAINGFTPSNGEIIHAVKRSGDIEIMTDQSAITATIDRSDSGITFTSSPIDACNDIYTGLELQDNRSVSLETECITDCETYQEAATNCNFGDTTGCSLNTEGDEASCECTTAITTDADSWYKLDDSAFDVNSCLQKSIKNVFGNDGVTLGANQAAGGWTDEQGDVCSPRWPCIDSQSDYISIIEKSIGNCNQDNDNDQDNEMKLSFCQPYGENASFEDCNGHKNKTDCEGHSDVDGEKCAWNPYCLQNSGTRSGIKGIEGGAPSDPANDPRPCKAHLDHQNCMNDNDCFWNWGLAEELNGFRNSDNKIVSTNTKISDIKSRFSSTSQDVCRDDRGSTVDNIHCSVLSGLNTITSGRDLGFCPGESCSATDSTHAYCQYCSTLALDDNTFGFIPSGLTGLIEDARVYTGTNSGNLDINIENNRCHKLFKN